MKRIMLCSIALFILFYGEVCQLNADPIRFDYMGVVNTISSSPSGAPLTNSIFPGDLITGYYIFDSTPPDGFPLDNTIGSYTIKASPAWMRVMITVNTFDFANSLNFTINNGIPDRYIVQAPTPVPTTLGVTITLEDSTGNAFNTDSLPLTPPDLNTFGKKEFVLTGSYLAGSYNITIEGTLTSLTLSTQPVPEPATMILLGSGLIGLAGYGRKKFFKK